MKKGVGEGGGKIIIMIFHSIRPNNGSLMKKV